MTVAWDGTDPYLFTRTYCPGTPGPYPVRDTQDSPDPHLWAIPRKHSVPVCSCHKAVEDKIQHTQSPEPSWYLRKAETFPFILTKELLEEWSMGQI